MTTIIVDTSAILAVFDESYAEHAAIARALEQAEDLLVVSPMVVAETDYMLASRLGPKAARQFGADIAGEAYDLAEWTSADHAAALAVIGQQGDDSDYLGIADASNVILADRHRTTTILTLDQRHFRRLRPLWAPTISLCSPTTSDPAARQRMHPLVACGGCAGSLMSPLAGIASPRRTTPA